jgi:hypothetical protein
MSISKIIWFALAGLVLIIFLGVIPIDEYDRHVILYGFGCSILFFGCLFFALADFKSIDEVTEKGTFDNPTHPTRKLAPFVIIPAILLPFALIFYQSSRVETELEKFGVMTKGKVTGGESSTTSRRGQKSTSYDINFTYTDSANNSYNVEDGVNGDEFDKLYEGAVIDVVYSSKHPGLAEAVLSLKDLQKYKKIAMSDVGIEHLIPLLEGTVKDDSIMSYLNTVCYEWQINDSKNYFINNFKEVAIEVAEDRSRVVYIKQTTAYAYDLNQPFEKSLETYGFKKKSSTTDGKTNEMFYTDKYTIIKERQVAESDNNSNILGQTAFDIWYVDKVQ